MLKVHNDATALQRVLDARFEFIQTSTFYTVLVSQVTPVLSRAIPTAATNGKTHYFNPDFVNKLPQEELLGVQAHESEHDGRRHSSRRGWREPEEWNRCTDYAINIDLIDHGFKLPKGALVDARFRGMSAEDIYRTREIERAEKAREEQEKQKSQKPPEGDEAQSDEDEAGEPDAGEEPSEEPDEEPGEAGNGNGGEPGEDGQEKGAQDGAGEAEDGAPGEGSQGAAEATGEAPGGKGEGSGGTGEPVSCGDPGGCGEVLDASETPAEMAASDAHWETVLKQAAMMSNKRGDAPGHVKREIESCDHPPRDWRETLRAYFDGGADVTQTWNKPNRRYIGGGLYLPGNVRDGVNKVVFMIDTSGSVLYCADALEAIKVETQAALAEGVIDECVVLYGDTAVTRVDEYRNGDEIEFDPKGGGGTDLRPMFKHVEDEIDSASLIVCFTDGEIGDPGPEPTCPVLFAYAGYPDRLKYYLDNPPWGAAAIEVRPVLN